MEEQGSIANSLQDLASVDTPLAGGKALGLKRLIDAGARVPRGVVLVTPDESALSSVEEYLKGEPELPRAVRSSAVDEDGRKASFAGQFESYLNLSNTQSVLRAVIDCVESSTNSRVASYAKHTIEGADLSLSVIIQDMVDAAWAGVMFTADPVENRFDRYLVNVVSGTGDKLVSGEVTGREYIFNRNQHIIHQSGDSSDMDEDLLKQVVAEGVELSSKIGYPLDLEWAVDKEGILYWLQARPITTLPQVHANELDSIPEAADTCVTRCNVGEMMPGPVTPLTASVFGRGIDYGFQDYLIRVGCLKEFHLEKRFAPMYYNHLFMSVDEASRIVSGVMFTDKENVEYNLLGYALHDGRGVPLMHPLKRFFNLFRYLRYTGSASKRLDQLRKLEKNFYIDHKQSMEKLYNDISQRKEEINEAWAHHYVTSSKSGVMNAFMFQILQRAYEGTDQERLQVNSSLMVDIGNVDGADALAELEYLSNILARSPEQKELVLSGNNEDIIAWLEGEESREAGAAYRGFIKRHGHRCVREAELWEKDWATEPERLVDIIRMKMNFPRANNRQQSTYEENLILLKEKIDSLSFFLMKKISKSARKGVVSRENSKSICIKMQSRLKYAYLALADMMVNARLLKDSQEIFFLTHEEIGQLFETKDLSLQLMAEERRNLYPSLFELEFDDVYYGFPHPKEKENNLPLALDSQLTGQGVSSGRVIARARVVFSLEEAGELRPGEIMVVSYTDVGWTPYFSIISGLVTEIGSTLSHGAVVAREYGIPTVVSVKRAKSVIKTGDIVELDGTAGRVSIVEYAPEQGLIGEDTL